MSSSDKVRKKFRKIPSPILKFNWENGHTLAQADIDKDRGHTNTHRGQDDLRRLLLSFLDSNVS